MVDKWEITRQTYDFGLWVCLKMGQTMVDQMAIKNEGRREDDDG
jgi:hypothetical protein